MNIDFNKIVELGTKLKLEKNQHYKEEFITK
jgi:hypothetical protein